jgi:heat shock protein HslJ
MKKILFYAMIVVLAAGVEACKTQQKASKPDAGGISPAVEKLAAANDGITNKYWKLVELNGNPVSYSEGVKGEAFISLKPDGTVHGNLGCNTFAGSYTLEAGNRIRFTNLINTQKMCMDMNIETEMLRVLNAADSYNVNEKELALNRARMAPLARFEAVYMK